MMKKKKSLRKSDLKGFEIKMPELQVVNKLNSYALAFSLGFLSAVYMLGLSILGKMGLALGAVEIMKQIHMTYSLTWSGIIGGVAESALCGAVSGFLIAWIYNKFI